MRNLMKLRNPLIYNRLPLSREAWHRLRNKKPCGPLDRIIKPKPKTNKTMNSCYPARNFSSNRFFNLADALFSERSGSAETSTWTPRVDVIEAEGHFEVLAELPGVSANEVKVVVRDGVLTLSGERPAVANAEGTRTHLSERRTGPFQRRFALPKNVDGENVRAEFKNGILSISVPKREEVKPREIEIKVA